MYTFINTFPELNHSKHVPAGFYSGFFRNFTNLTRFVKKYWNVEVGF
jgi:hypothetical protein